MFNVLKALIKKLDNMQEQMCNGNYKIESQRNDGNKKH